MEELYTLPALISQFRKIEKPILKDEREPEISANDVMCQIEKALPELADGDLKKLLDPCVALVLAGYKPTTFLYKGPLQTPSEIYGRHEIDILNGTPISLIAARNRLRESKLLQIVLQKVEIDYPTTVEQFDRLNSAIYNETSQTIGTHAHIPDIISDGITLGYPDQAILDFAIAYFRDKKKGDSHDHRNRLIPTEIVEGNSKLEYLLEHYPSPDFDVSPEHANDPSVVSASSKQRAFLEEFYSLPQVIAMLESVGIQKD